VSKSTHIANDTKYKSFVKHFIKKVLSSRTSEIPRAHLGSDGKKPGGYFFHAQAWTHNSHGKTGSPPKKHKKIRPGFPERIFFIFYFLARISHE
jgi:hypothetical protein